jgi:hypothetical protein
MKNAWLVLVALVALVALVPASALAVSLPTNTSEDATVAYVASIIPLQYPQWSGFYTPSVLRSAAINGFDEAHRGEYSGGATQQTALMTYPPLSALMLPDRSIVQSLVGKTWFGHEVILGDYFGSGNYIVIKNWYPGATGIPGDSRDYYIAR